MMMQEKEYAETVVSSNTCECQCCTQINVPHHPVDVSGSVVSLNYSASGKQKKLSRKIQTTWYKRYPWITVCTSTCTTSLLLKIKSRGQPLIKYLPTPLEQVLVACREGYSCRQLLCTYKEEMDQRKLLL